MGVELTLVDDGESVRLLADPPMDPFREVPVGEGGRGLEGIVPAIADPPPGLFAARAELRYNLPYQTIANADGRYDTMRVIVNRRRFTRDSTELLGLGYERGLLVPGGPPDGLWERTAGAARDAAGRWQPPGGRWPDTLVGELGAVAVANVGIVAALLRRDGGWRGFGGAGPGAAAPIPAAGADVAGARFGWPGWDEPAWRARPRPAVAAMREAFTRIDARGGTAPRVTPAGRPSSTARRGRGNRPRSHGREPPPAPG